MVEKVSLSVAIVAILISAASIAYSNSTIGGISGQIDQAKRDLVGQVSSQATQVNSKISPLESSVGSVKQEQTAIRNLVEQRIGGLEKSLQEAQTRLAQAEKAAQQSQAELQALQAERALEEAAKKEKAPIIYATMDAPDFLNIIWPRFREAYPWAPAEPRYVEGFAPLINRFLSEYQAGTPSADVLIEQVAPMRGQLLEYMAPYPDMKYMSLYPDYAIYPSRNNPQEFYANINIPVIVYNTNILKEQEAPTGWLDLANPKWKNNIAMQDAIRLGSNVQVLADLLPALGQARWDQFMKGLAANKPILTGSASEAYTKVIAGEVHAAVGLINSVLAQKPGTPVAIAWPKEEPKAMTVQPGSMIGISKKATNPNFAKLFTQWFLSPAGQKALSETKRIPALPTLDAPTALSKVFPQGLGTLPFNDEVIRDNAKWQNLMKSYLG
ncbi:MAG: extracellular solute-binding protein [Thaumarchaeota archaeon]|nr:extracellular solute-binding protein [Nitrososphaerota archaeon]